MRAGVIFTGTGPILILTSHDSLTDAALVARLAAKGIGKFIAHEVPIDEVRRGYGPTFSRVMTDLRQDDGLRILDIDGTHIFGHLHLRDLGPTLVVEPEPASSRA